MNGPSAKAGGTPTDRTIWGEGTISAGCAAADAPITLILASRNRHKLAEMQRLLGPCGIVVEPLPDVVALPPEQGDTFEANALPKARAAAAATARAAIADDSGIEAAALGGAPGVRSARYAGPRARDAENIAKLVSEAPAGSPVRFVCALAYVDPAAGEEQVFFGECRGTLAARPRGGGGFGYDPVFECSEDEQGRTVAELSDQEKDAISHRARAARALAAWLRRRTAGDQPEASGPSAG